VFPLLTQSGKQQQKSIALVFRFAFVLRAFFKEINGVSFD
jgi:hypothetical protein